MAPTSTPVSFLDLSSTSQSILSFDTLTPLRRQRSQAVSHYRPFSTCSPEITSEVRPRPHRQSIIRPSSSFGSMGFSFKDKAKEKEREQGPRNVSDSFKLPEKLTTRSQVFPRSATLPKQATERPSSSHGASILPKQKGLKKKRSLASLLSAATEGKSGPSLITHSISAAPSLGSSPLATIPSVSNSPVAETPKVVTPVAQGGGQATRHKPQNKFIRKNTWLKRQDMKVHPYPEEAPYMQAYDPILLDNDRHTDYLLRRINHLDSPSFHDYGRKPPLYTLDLGCGSGHWLLNACTVWTNSQHTGFDMVDTLIPELRKQDNIQFVRGNFLNNSLPFSDKSFDLVRMANLTLCIPYDKWDFIFSEVQRVLTIDGRLELIDDQIFFPYGPPLISGPSVASSSSSRTSVRTSGTFFDIDADALGEEDRNSMDTESTLFSDGDTSASSLKKSPSNHRHAIRAPLGPALSETLSSDDPDTPRSTTTITTNHLSDPSRLSSWSLEASASRDLETVYETMLNKKFGIHTRPSDFVIDIMKHAFGNGRKIKSCHLKLAPRDAITGSKRSSGASPDNVGSSGEAGNDREDKVTGDSVVGHMMNEFKPWFADKEEKKRLKREKKLAKAESLTPSISRSSEDSFTPDTHVPLGISNKAALRLGIREDVPAKGKGTSQIPEKLSTKAANRLGIDEECSQRPSTSARRLSFVNFDSDDSEASEDSPLSLTAKDRPTPVLEESEDEDEDPMATPVVSENRLSAKAANRLGISYSALTAAAAASSQRPRSSSSSLLTNSTSTTTTSTSTSTSTIQSPGLLLWPSTYIPLSPTELEMHACKHIHTLLGCKPALSEFIKSYVDEKGERFVNDEEFDQSMWDYECFRRRRFHWPSEVPDWDLLPPAGRDDSTPKTTKPSTPRTSTSSDHDPTAPRNLSDTHHGPYMCDELTHVRTIRIFEAVKVEDYSLASLPFPRSPAPRPPKG